MMNQLQTIVNEYGIGISKEELASKIYWQLKALKIENVVILNTKYLEIESNAYQFIKSKKQNCWIVKEF